jgi:hypothetical protein
MSDENVNIEQAIEYLQSAHHNMGNVIRGIVPGAIVKDQIASALRALGDEPFV